MDQDAPSPRDPTPSIAPTTAASSWRPTVSTNSCLSGFNSGKPRGGDANERYGYRYLLDVVCSRHLGSTPFIGFFSSQLHRGRVGLEKIGEGSSKAGGDVEAVVRSGQEA